MAWWSIPCSKAHLMPWKACFSRLSKKVFILPFIGKMQTSAKAFRKFYPDKKVSKNMYCVNHVVCSHIKALNECHSKKSFNEEFIKRVEKRFPQILYPKISTLTGTKHGHDDCGCLKPAYHDINARINFQSALIQSGNCAETFRNRMLTLPWHVRDDHSQCNFHKTLLCPCGKCCGKEQLDCSGKEYHTKHPITCPMHSLVYEIKCHHRAQQTEKLIHPILGMGYTNQNEASHNVYIRYRSNRKGCAILSTNLGLAKYNVICPQITHSKVQVTIGSLNCFSVSICLCLMEWKRPF